MQKNVKTVYADTLIEPEFTGNWFGRISDLMTIILT